MPYSSIHTSCYLSACNKTPGTSVITIYISSFASTVHDIIIASNETIGEPVSALVFYILSLGSAICTTSCFYSAIAHFFQEY